MSNIDSQIISGLFIKFTTKCHTEADRPIFFYRFVVQLRSLILSQENPKIGGSEIAEELPHRGGGRILIVDDEEDITFFLKEALEDHGGFEVVTFNDPLLALSSFNHEDKQNKPSEYDLILLDIKMPKMDGFELYQELQKRIYSAEGASTSGKDQDRKEKRTKICFMTAFEVYFEALKEIFPDSYSSICFIKKPSSAEDLIKRITSEIDSV